MKVYLTATPEYSPVEFEQVLQLLKSLSGPVEFIDGKIIPKNIMDISFPTYENHDQLFFDDFWKITDNYRVLNNLDIQDYVALLTPKKNVGNWFSAFNGNNLFVDTNDWDLYTEKESKYGIAFSVVENIIQTLMNLNIEDLDEEPNIHDPSIGCINDFCLNKQDIMFKLRNAYICNSCQQRLKREITDIPTVTHLIQLIEYISTQMVDNFSWLNEIEIEQVTVDQAGILKIGENVISLGLQNKSIYFLFLNNTDGILTSSLADHKQQGAELYYLLKYPKRKVKSQNQIVLNELEIHSKKIDEVKLNEIKSSISKILDNVETDRFRQEKSKINSEIKKVVGLKMAEFYIIDIIRGESNVYKLKVEKENISLDPKFTIK